MSREVGSRKRCLAHLLWGHSNKPSWPSDTESRSSSRYERTQKACHVCVLCGCAPCARATSIAPGLNSWYAENQTELLVPKCKGRETFILVFRIYADRRRACHAFEHSCLHVATTTFIGPSYICAYMQRNRTYLSSRTSSTAFRQAGRCDQHPLLNLAPGSTRAQHRSSHTHL